MRSWMSFGCCLLSLTGCAVGVGGEEAGICEQVVDHLAECGSALSWSASSCDETAAEVALLLSCDALESSATSGKADGASACMALCEAEGGGEALCGRLCRALNGQRQIGDTCDVSADCESSYCHPVYRICTEQCAGYCPGQDTFCITDPTYAAESSTLHGFCVIQAESPDECGRSAHYKVGCFAYTLSDSFESAVRHVGDSGAPRISTFVCAPQTNDIYVCNQPRGSCYPSCGGGD